MGRSCWLAAPAMAQDYRARVQGQITDESRGALPGVTVTLLNEATGVVVRSRHRRRRALPVRLRRSGQLQRHRGAAGLPRGRAEGGARAAARRRHRRSADGAGDGRRDHHGAGIVAAGAVQFEQLGPDARTRSSSTRCRLADATRTTWRTSIRRSSTRPGRRRRRTGRTTTPTPTTTTPAAAPAAPTPSCSTASRSARATRRPTRRRWTRSRKSPSPRAASTPRTATASAA